MASCYGNDKGLYRQNGAVQNSDLLISQSGTALEYHDHIQEVRYNIRTHGENDRNDARERIRG